MGAEECQIQLSIVEQTLFGDASSMCITLS